MFAYLSRRTRLATVLASLLILALAAWWTLRSPTAAVIKPMAGPLVRSLQFSARVATASRVELGSTITGRVREVLAVAGAELRQGQVLARLEDEELRAALAQAVAGAGQARARVDGLRGTGRSSASAALAQADSVWVAAQAELRRAEDLVARGFVSASRLDEARRAAAVAQAQQAQARAQSAANADQGSEVVQAQAQLALAESTVQAASARLAQSVLVAPADGRLLERRVEPGQIVQAGRALFHLALKGPLQLVAQVDERYLDQLRVGQTAAVRADAFAGQGFAATLLSIAPWVDAQRGAIEIKFAVAQPPGFLREDMTLSVEVETARRDKALVLPLQALRQAQAAGSDAASVWIAHQGRVQERLLRTGLRTLESVEVLEGLSAEEWVLLGPAPAPGRRVRADPQAAAALLQTKASGGDGASALTNAMGR